MKTPTEKTWILRRKLQALADRGIDGERAAAQKKLARLEKLFDFTETEHEGNNLFAGDFTPSRGDARELCRFTASETDIASFAKWAIERGTGIACLWRHPGPFDSVLCAEASAASVPRLLRIAQTIRETFDTLWTSYQNAPGARPGDRQPFLLGLYDGMMIEPRLTGQALPGGTVGRASTRAAKRPKKTAVSTPAGIALHPYALGMDMGRKVRLCVNVEEIAAPLRTEPEQIAA